MGLLARLYGLGVAVRNRRYDRGSATAVKLPLKVVSVGNVTVGGSGKSPVVAALARDLLARGRRVAVLSRGYRRRSRAPFVLVSDGERVASAVEESGDEPFELASTLAGVAVAVSPDRVEGGRRLLSRIRPDVLLLDDGFQHRRLYRDLDLVCFDAGEPESSFRLLPAGRLREPMSSLGRAHAVVWTRWCEGRDLDRIRARFARPLFEIRTRSRVTDLTPVDAAGGVLPPDAFRDEPVGVLLGVARPERIVESLEAQVVSRTLRPDHHWWTPGEVEAARREASNRGAKALLTTGKDAVKMGFLSGAPSSLPVFAIRHEAEILDADTSILAELFERAEVV